MTVEWIAAIFNRTYGDVLNAEMDRYVEDGKGCYNAFDLNRIENDTKYVMEYMYEIKIIRTLPAMRFKLDWTPSDIPTREDFTRIISNINWLIQNSNPNILEYLSPINTDLVMLQQITFELANEIERNLEIMHTQEPLLIKKWLLKVNNGIIEEYGKSAEYIAEEEVVHISFNPTGEDAPYMVFTRWSGDTNKLQYVGDPEQPNTTYKMVYWENEEEQIELTAEYKVRYPRTLKINGGYILDGTGDTTRSLFAGDEVLIVANEAATGKVFYEWQGTPEALENLNGVTDNEDPSTSWLTMPDCNVELTSFFINAGKHTVYVDDVAQGAYDYKESVYLSAPDKGPKWGFSYWTGDTQYLEDGPTSSSLIMPDITLRFYSHFEYIYSYNTVSVINGTIKDNDGNYVTRADDLREQSSHQLQYNTPPAGKGFQKWSVSGAGYVSGSSFVVGDGNGIVTAHYGNLRNINKVNSVTGETTTIQCVEGTRHVLSHPNVSGYTFTGYSSDDVQIQYSSNIGYYFTMPDKDITVNMNYRPNVSLTTININNSGQENTSSVNYNSGYRWHTNMFVGDYVFDHWEINGSNVGSTEYYPSGYYDRYYVRSDTTVKAVYRQKVTRTLTVNNGHISGGGTSGQYLEGTSVNIIADDGTEDFNGWSISGAYSTSNVDNINASLVMGRGTDVVATANYANRYTVNVTGGTGSGTYKSGTRVRCVANQAPNSYEFKRWEENGSVVSYSQTYEFYISNNRNLTAIYEPIPYFDVELVDAHFEDGTTKKTLIRNSQEKIIANIAPEGMRFLVWEVLVGEPDNSVSQPFASTTTIRNLTENLKLQAKFIVPDPTILYTLTVTGKDGKPNSATGNYPAGESVDIYADTPDEGWYFYKWTGDIRYVTDIEAENTSVTIPGKDITLGMDYRRVGSKEQQHVWISRGKILLQEEGQEDRWVEEGNFDEGSVLTIKADTVSVDKKFNRWVAPEGYENSETTVADLTAPKTTITVRRFPIQLDADIIDRKQFIFTISNENSYDNPVSGPYFESQPFTLLFNKYVNQTDEEHIQFINWAGDDIKYLNLADTGKGIDVTNPNEQVVRMPNRNITISANYTSSYPLKIDGITKDYYAEGDKVNVSAVEEEGKKFLFWSGDTSCIDNIYNPNIVVTMPKFGVNIIPVFSSVTDANSIGYVLTSLLNNDIINNEDIQIISGQLENGFIITDKDGHVYVITTYGENQSRIMRLTQVQGGQENGE